MLRIATLSKWLAGAAWLLAAALASAQSVTGPANQSGIWWNPAEGGRGLTVQRNDAGVTFAAWFTYDKKGKATWYHMPNGRPDPANANVVVGDVFHPTGPSYTAQVFDPAQVSVGSPVGQFRIEWANDESATFTFDVEGVHGSTSLQPFLYMRDTMIGSRYQPTRSIFWNPNEGGWGLAHYYGPTGTNASITAARADFGVWFTYDDDHEATWFAMSDIIRGDFFDTLEVSGSLYRYTGPSLSAAFDPGAAHGAKVGTMYFQSFDGAPFSIDRFQYDIELPGSPATETRFKTGLQRFTF